MPSPEHVFKLVVTGPFSAGKTTLIQTVVEREFLTLAAGTTTDGETAVKRSTTIGMDFGVLTLEDPDGDVELRVYGTPGQERFSFMWEVLAEGADAYVLVVDGTTPASWEQARAHHAVMARTGIPGVVAVNRGGGPAVAAVAADLADLGVPVHGCDATDVDAVREVLVLALVEVLDQLEHEDLRAAPDAPMVHHVEPGGAR